MASSPVRGIALGMIETRRMVPAIEAADAPAGQPAEAHRRRGSLQRVAAEATRVGGFQAMGGCLGIRMEGLPRQRQ